MVQDMHFRITATIFFALSIWGGAAMAATAYPNTTEFGNPVDRQAHWYRACMRARNAKPPASDLGATPAESPCDAQLFYYDTLDNTDATSADWARVRACAFATHDNAVLMMLYANGLGVKANRKLALNYACRLGGAPMELWGRTDTLSHPAESSALPRGNAALPGEHGTLFDQCDDAASRLTINTCAAIAQRRNAHAAHAQLALLTGSWQPGQRAALSRLQTALQGFADARGRYEADLTGTLGPLYAPAAENARAAEVSQFIDDLKRYEKGRLPKYTAAQRAGFSDQLGQAYRTLLADAPRGAASGIRATEQAWEEYRNAWVAFGKARYPAVPADAWEARLTARRIKQLRHLQRELRHRK